KLLTQPPPPWQRFVKQQDATHWLKGVRRLRNLNSVNPRTGGSVPAPQSPCYDRFFFSASVPCWFFLSLRELARYVFSRSYTRLKFQDASGRSTEREP